MPVRGPGIGQSVKKLQGEGGGGRPEGCPRDPGTPAPVTPALAPGTAPASRASPPLPGTAMLFRADLRDRPEGPVNHTRSPWGCRATWDPGTRPSGAAADTSEARTPFRQLQPFTHISRDGAVQPGSVRAQRPSNPHAASAAAFRTPAGTVHRPARRSRFLSTWIDLLHRSTDFCAL